MNLGGMVDMKSVISEGHRGADSDNNKKCFIEWSEGVSFTVEVKRRGILSRATQTSTGRTAQGRWSVGLRVNAGFFAIGATCRPVGRRLEDQGYGPSMSQDLFGQDLLGPEWEMATFRTAEGLAGSIDNWLRTFKVR